MRAPCAPTSTIAAAITFLQSGITRSAEDSLLGKDRRLPIRIDSVDARKGKADARRNGRQVQGFFGPESARSCHLCLKRRTSGMTGVKAQLWVISKS